MLSVNNKLESGTVFGVTPFYYMMFSDGAKESVNSIVSVMPIDVTLRFINAVEEMAETILFISDENNTSSLPEEDKALLLNENVIRYFVDAVEKNALVWTEGLTEIKQKSSETYTDVNFRIGSATIGDLLSMTAQDMERRMKDEISPFLDGPVGDSNSLNTIEYVDLSMKLIEEIKAGIVLIDRKLESLGVNIKNRDSSFLTQRIKTILSEVEYLDHCMINCMDNYVTDLRSCMRKLNVDSKITLYPEVAKQKTSVESLFSKKYNNNSLRISLESKRNCFERNIVTLTSKIEAVRFEASTDIFYF